MPLKPILNGTNIALVAVFAALTAVSTLPPEFTLAAGVPLSLQTLAVVLAGLVLGAWRGAAAITLYLVVGISGAPIFSNAGAGWAYFTGATGGFLWSFPLAAFVVGWLAERVRAQIAGVTDWTAFLGAGLVSSPLIYAVGVPWLAHFTGLPLLNAPDGGTTAVSAGLTPFIAGDVIKVFAAASVAAAIHRAFPQVLSAHGGLFAGAVSTPTRSKAAKVAA